MKYEKLYRLLRHDEYEALKRGEDIQSKDPNADIEATLHVCKTRDNTQWISSTFEPFAVLDWAIETRDFALIEIDASKVECYDLSDDADAEKLNFTASTFRGWAKGKREVLIKGKIPYDACRIIIDEGGFKVPAEPCDLSRFECMLLKDVFSALWAYMNELILSQQIGKAKTVLAYAIELASTDAHRDWKARSREAGYPDKYILKYKAEAMEEKRNQKAQERRAA